MKVKLKKLEDILNINKQETMKCGTVLYLLSKQGMEFDITESKDDSNCYIVDDIVLIPKIYFEKPKTDWSKVPVDAKVSVVNTIDGRILKRHFAKYEDGKIYTYMNGETSWSSSGNLSNWNIDEVELYEEVTK